MPWLGASQQLPRRPCRVVVAGTSGSGKTTLARRIAAELGTDHFELDALHHGPKWSVRPDFVPDVRRWAAMPAWVTEWQYDEVRPLLTARADLVVWLDLPLWLVMSRVIRRTVRRAVRREILWNGNVEPPLSDVLRDRDHIVRWVWRTHREVARQVRRLAVSQPGLDVVQLRSPQEVARWLRGPLHRLSQIGGNRMNLPPIHWEIQP
jgi:adenylate kinase family enzyme